ncbi:MAG: GH92 family glycosyl hydrolase [Bacteroidota bacterium]
MLNLKPGNVVKQYKGLMILMLQFTFIINVIVAQQKTDYSTMVNPFIGTGGHGHTYPGVILPFGMVQLSPDTRLEGWDGCSAYHYSDSVIYGFSHTHLSGTGCSDYGDILLMPSSGKVALKNYGYAAAFNHKDEKAYAGYYGVKFANDIQVELTATARCGLHKYIFPKSSNNHVVLNLVHRDEVLESYIVFENDSTISGLRRSKAWADDQYVYFTLNFSKPISKAQMLRNDSLIDIPRNQKVSDKNIITAFSFQNIKEVYVRVAISGVSVEGAKKNLKAEISDWNFAGILAKAKNEWNKELGKIEVEASTKDQQEVFYTAMYHSMSAPNLYSDVDGSFRGRDLKIHKTDGWDCYTVFSLWDTYRAEHPLFTIIEPKRTLDFIKTFLSQYETGGILPVWELSGNETNCMIGYHSVPVIVDAYIKGIKNFDVNKMLEAMKSGANSDKRGLLPYRKYGYIPYDIESESVSKTLEYSYDDWCIAQFAKSIGKMEDYKEFMKRGQFYKNVFDPSTGFFRAKANGKWFAPFDPKEVNFNYTEANAYQYSMAVPQDISGFIKLLGGIKNFETKLDTLFLTDSKTSGRDQSDISGMVGQYAHGNEPSHHMAYLYNYAGTPWKTQAMVKRIMNEQYFQKPDGLCGNEDCGQMSAWYVISAMGIYSVTPGTNVYNISSPLFDKITLHLENGKEVVISAPDASKKTYIQSLKVNDTNWNSPFITHEQLINGGKLEFQMADQPNKMWGLGNEITQPSTITDNFITINPYVSSGEKVYADSCLISLSSLDNSSAIYYTLDDKKPDMNSIQYKKPFYISSTTNMNYIAYNPTTGYSKMGSSVFTKIKKGMKIKLLTKYAPQYSGGGDEALIDNIKGANDFRTGTWQGYEGINLEAVIDLGKSSSVHLVGIGCLQDIGAWIFMPSKVTVLVSDDNVNFKEVAVVMNDIPQKSKEAITKLFEANKLNLTTRYIKIIAQNMGNCPDWHPGAGGKSWIFADEITIK